MSIEKQERTFHKVDICALGKQIHLKAWHRQCEVVFRNGKWVWLKEVEVIPRFIGEKIVFDVALVDGATSAPEHFYYNKAIITHFSCDKCGWVGKDKKNHKCDK